MPIFLLPVFSQRHKEQTNYKAQATYHSYYRQVGFYHFYDIHVDNMSDRVLVHCLARKLINQHILLVGQFYLISSYSALRYNVQSFLLHNHLQNIQDSSLKAQEMICGMVSVLFLVGMTPVIVALNNRLVSTVIQTG